METVTPELRAILRTLYPGAGVSVSSATHAAPVVGRVAKVGQAVLVVNTAKGQRSIVVIDITGIEVR